MDARFEKYWFEAFAKELLEALYPEIYHNMVIADKPDIQMDNGHGIEVTRAVYNNQNENERLYCKFRPNGTPIPFEPA